MNGTLLRIAPLTIFAEFSNQERPNSVIELKKMAKRYHWTGPGFVRTVFSWCWLKLSFCTGELDAPDEWWESYPL